MKNIKLGEIKNIYLACRIFRYSKVRKSGCIEWTGSKGVHPNSYGKMKAEGKVVSAHRASYLAFKGKIGKLCVLHSCDNPSCVNPEHLFLGTQKDNALDRSKKRRYWKGKIKYKEKP